jgi:hypothetical protein
VKHGGSGVPFAVSFSLQSFPAEYDGFLTLTLTASTQAILQIRLM